MSKATKLEKEQYKRTECEAETLHIVEKCILHPLLVDAMKLGWKTVNKGQYASRADEIDPNLVDINTIFNIKGDERVIAGLLDHIPGDNGQKADGLKNALAPYVQPTINSFSYKDISPEKMGVFIDMKAIKHDKESIIHEACCPGESKFYCKTLKHEIEYMDFAGTPLNKKQMYAYYKLKRFIQSKSKIKGKRFIREMASEDKNLLHNREGMERAESAAKKTSQMLKLLIFRNPKRIIMFRVTKYQKL